MQRPAFLVIDMQREWLENARRPVHGLGDAFEIIDHVAQTFRAASLPVIHVLDEDSVRPGDPGFEVVPQIRIDPLDRKMHKPHGSAFRETTLVPILQELRVDWLVVAGFKAEACVLSTIKGAEERGIPYALLRGAVVSTDPTAAAFLEKISPLVSHDVLTRLVARPS